jgi:hypothetical protein
MTLPSRTDVILLLIRRSAGQNSAMVLISSACTKISWPAAAGPLRSLLGFRELHKPRDGESSPFH